MQGPGNLFALLDQNIERLIKKDKIFGFMQKELRLTLDWDKFS